jgi:hypothetical protein
MIVDTAARKFKSVLKNPNFMTPDVIRYGETPSHIFELSEGTDLKGQPIYGVTVIDWAIHPSDRKHNIELSEMFYSREFAEAYIADLR